MKEITPGGWTTEEREQIDGAQEGGKTRLPNSTNIVQMHRVLSAYTYHPLRTGRILQAQRAALHLAPSAPSTIIRALDPTNRGHRSPRPGRNEE